jgi:hypothetical protein
MWERLVGRSCPCLSSARNPRHHHSGCLCPSWGPRYSQQLAKGHDGTEHGKDTGQLSLVWYE